MLKENKKLPVTLLSGFLGAGKTTLINNALRNTDGLRIAIIVNDMSVVNIDATLIDRGGSSLTRTEEKLVEMSNGCICCTLREDLLIQVNELATSGKYDYLLIESTGISEPLPVATTFDFRDEDGNSLSDVARLDTLVTVVDAANLIKNYSSTDFLKDKGESLGEEDDRTLVDLIVDQIEFANVIILNKIDLVSKEELKIVKSIIRGLNIKAKVIETSMSKVDLGLIMNTGLYNLEEAQEHPLWAQELFNFKDHKSEIEEYGITSFVYKRRNPFDPKKLYNFFNSEWPGVIRAKGYFWVSTRPEFAGEISQAGAFIQHECMGLWWDAVPKDQLPEGEDFDRLVQKYWHQDYGDRRQEIVFIGLHSEMNEQEICSRLDECLIDNYLENPEKYQDISDPFPEWIKETA